MVTMERSEPSLVPEWLRSNGGGGSAHQFASSQADGSVFAFPGGSKSSKSVNNTDSLHSPVLDRNNSSNYRRSSSGNGFSKHNGSSNAVSYSSFSRNHRVRDRERSVIADNRDSKYSDPLKGMISGLVEDPFRRSKSLISRSQGEAPQQRNGGLKNHYNGNGTYTVDGNVTGNHKVSFERDFPVLGSEDSPKTPDVIRVSSPGLSRGIQCLSIANPPSVGNEAWTSALAEVRSGPGSNIGVGFLPGLQPVTTSSTSSSNSVAVPAYTSPALNMAEALVQAPGQVLNMSQESVQQQKDELALAQSKKLIPMIPLVPKTMAPSSSDKLKPKTAMKSFDTTITPKNGTQHLSPLQVGSQPIRGATVRGDDPNSPSSGKLLLLKHGRENGVSPCTKDVLSPSTNVNNRFSNGQSTGYPSVSCGPSKNLHKLKIVPDKRTSRSNFFKLMREKSLNNTSGAVGSGASVLSNVVDKESKILAGSQATPETGSELKFNGEPYTVADGFSPSMMIDNEEERAFLLSLGWEDNAEDDEEGLTEEEIYAFYKDEVMKQGPTSKICQVLQAKVFPLVGCSSSNEVHNPASQTEA